MVNSTSYGNSMSLVKLMILKIMWKLLPTKKIVSEPNIRTTTSHIIHSTIK